MENASRAKHKHVVLLPFPGQGHLASFLAVARLLRRELPNANITIVSTPRNVAALRASYEQDEAPSASSIGFHALPFVPEDHGLPPGCESTSALPLAEFITLFEAFDSLEPAFDAYVTCLRECGAENVCIVSDVFVAWTVDVARRRGCAHAFLVSCGAFGTAVLYALWRNSPALPFDPRDGELRLPELLPEVPELDRSQLTPALLPGDGRWTAYHHRLIRRGYETDAVLINTAEELEPTGLAMLRRTLLGEAPVFPIGPLVRTSSVADNTDGRDAVLPWLDAQPPRSVLYISFGSQNTIRANQMTDLAGALESTCRPFIWAIRPPVGHDIAGAFRDEWLPEGFEARARAGNRGFLVCGWAPQLGILSHAATGAFLTHGGWNSVLESLTRGVPLLGWPLAAEQFYNVKMLAEEWGVCVEVARGNMESSVVERARVVEAVEAVMGDALESRAIRRHIAEVREVLRNAWAEDGGSSRAALHEFFQAVRLR